jgi:hypothetical protein
MLSKFFPDTVSSPEENQDIKTANRSFDNVAQFRYLGTTVRNQHLSRRKLRGD